MEHSILFKEATIDDISVIQSLAYKIWHEWYIVIITKHQIDYMLADRYSEESLYAQMTLENQLFTLVYVDNVPLGYASVNTTDGKSYFLHKFYLDTSLHQKGVSKKLLQYLEQKYSPETLTLRVNRCNYKAINFYFKNGFFIQKVDDLDIGEGYKLEDFVMEKHFN